MKLLLSLIFFTLTFYANAQICPGQPAEGPGSGVYLHDDISMYDHSSYAEGYWLFEPTDPKPDSANLVIFNHGWGAYNPVVYGMWIRHLVQKGNIVIFPRYQMSLFTPPKYFADNTAQGIRDALKLLNQPGHVKPRVENAMMIGHSFGGVISATLITEYEKYNIPKPQAALICQPGYGPFSSGRLKSYSGFPADVIFVAIAGEDDFITQDKFARELYTTTEKVPASNKKLIIHHADEHGETPLGATHAEPTAIDTSLDSGDRNVIILRAMAIGTVDAVDHYCYWKLADALMDCAWLGNHCDIALGGTDKQRYMGEWSDGKPVVPLTVE